MSHTLQIDGHTGESVIPLGVGGSIAGSEQGAPVVLLHGWGGCRQIWDGTLKRCPEGFRFIALDLPGSGGSAPLGAYTIPALAQWVLDTVADMGIGHFDLVGHSLGGNVAACAAQLGAGRIKKLVLVDAALYSDRVPRARPVVHPVTGHAALALARAGAAALGALGMVVKDDDRGGFWRPYLRRNQYVVVANNHRAMYGQLRALVAHPFDLVRVPAEMQVLIMHGKKDQVIPFAFAHEMLASRPKNTRLIGYPHSMHCPMDTHPDHFVKDLTAFLHEGEAKTR